MNYNTNIFCTLFNSKYLDKGITLYNSLKNVCKDFKLYIFALDSITYNVLLDLKLENVVAISMEEFENTELLKVKKERSAAEYCWTCTPSTISYVFETYHEKICTYIDADMYFYSDPEPIFDEMQSNNNSIIIIGHRFPKRIEEKKNKIHGKYCVEFNTFVNNDIGNKCLEWWKKSCINKCHYSKKVNECVGDQTYLEEFEARFSGVQVSSIIGAGVAPWNVRNYSFFEKDGRIVLKEQSNVCQMIFYHFQNIRYMPFNLVNINSGTCSRFVKNRIYKSYLMEIEQTRRILFCKYKIEFTSKKSLYKNPILAFVQNYFLPFRIRHFNNIIRIKRSKKYDSL